MSYVELTNIKECHNCGNAIFRSDPGAYPNMWSHVKRNTAPVRECEAEVRYATPDYKDRK